MKQNHASNVLSKKFCACGCGRFIKQNLLDKNPDAEYIYKHYPLSKKNRPNANPKNKKFEEAENESK